MKKIAVAALVASLALMGACSAKEDSGKQACVMMQQDKTAHATPDGDRTQTELNLLKSSSNADLQQVAVAVQSGDLMQAANAIQLIYSGCAALGNPIT